MNRVKHSIFTAIFIATALTFFACDGGKSALIGKWDLVAGPAKNNPEDMELLSDGTGVVDKIGVTYKVENGRFYINYPKKEMSYSYEVSGATLTLTKYDSTILEYINIKRIKPTIFTNFTDFRNDKVYKTIKMLDGKVWFAENLNYAAEGSKCYGNKEENCQKYGRLYDWETAMKSCPNGWHLPSKAEWDDLVQVTGKKYLKAKEDWNGTDAFGFAARPGGYSYSSSNFNGASSYGYWWSASEGSRSFAYNRYMYCNHEYSLWNYSVKSFLFSVRCIENWQ